MLSHGANIYIFCANEAKLFRGILVYENSCTIASRWVQPQGNGVGIHKGSFFLRCIAVAQHAQARRGLGCIGRKKSGTKAHAKAEPTIPAMFFYNDFSRPSSPAVGSTAFMALLSNKSACDQMRFSAHAMTCPYHRTSQD